MYLNGTNLDWRTSHKYLGIILSNDFNDDLDIKRQIRYIYAKGNILARKFSNCSEDVKKRLFRSYCSNMYCCHLWGLYSKKSYRNITVAYNNIFRCLMKIKGQHSISNIFVSSNVDSFIVIHRKSICNFYIRLLNSSNSLISAITDSIHFQSMSSHVTKKWCPMIF